MAKPSFNSNSKRYNHGFYRIINEKKYIGNPLECMYRSLWEHNFMVYCDITDEIIRWASENDAIPWMDENGKMHKYFPDFYVEIVKKDDENQHKRVFYEIKPHKEIYPDFIDRETGGILPPKKNTLKAYQDFEYKLKTYKNNLLKWHYADEWCKNKHMEFKIIDEYFLKSKKIL